MHRGCFVWTPTPPLSGRRTPRPVSARVCVCVPLLAGSGGQASGARFCVTHPFLWQVLVRSLLARPPRAWVALFVVVAVFRLFFFFLTVRLVLSGVRCFPARAALGPCVLLSPRPPPPYFFLLRFPPPFFLFICFLLLLFFLFLPWCAGCAVHGWFVSVCVLGCAVWWCVLLSALCPGRSCLRCVVRCSLVVPVLCVLFPVVLCVAGGYVLAAFLFPELPTVPCLGALSFGLVLQRLRPVVALGSCGGVALLRRLMSCCSALRWSVLGGLFGVVFCPAVGCRVALSAPPPTRPLPRAVRSFLLLLLVCAGCAAAPPLPGWFWCRVLCVVVCCVV